jgi:hypothetical protein
MRYALHVTPRLCLYYSTLLGDSGSAAPGGGSKRGRPPHPTCSCRIRIRPFNKIASLLLLGPQHANQLNEELLILFFLYFNFMLFDDKKLKKERIFYFVLQCFFPKKFLLH